MLSIFTFRADFVDKFLDDLLWEWVQPRIDELAVSQARGQGVSLILGENRARIFKVLRSPGIDSKASIPPAY